MSFEAFFVVGFLILLVIVAGVIAHFRVPRKLKTEQFEQEWKQLQGYCRDKKRWAEAVAAADALLDKALRRRRFKGGTMGERMVSAQRAFTNNDALWFAHNYSKKLIANPNLRPKEADVKSALVGFRQALRDLGALNNGEKKRAK